MAQILSLVLLSGILSLGSAYPQRQSDAPGPQLSPAKKEAETIPEAASRLKAKMDALAFEPAVRDGVLAVLTAMPSLQKEYMQSMVDAIDYVALHPRSRTPVIGKL